MLTIIHGLSCGNPDVMPSRASRGRTAGHLRSRDRSASAGRSWPVRHATPDRGRDGRGPRWPSDRRHTGRSVPVLGRRPQNAGHHRPAPSRQITPRFPLAAHSKRRSTRLRGSSACKAAGMLRSCLLSRSYLRLEPTVRYTHDAGAMKALSRRAAGRRAETGRWGAPARGAPARGAPARGAGSCGSLVTGLDGRGHG